MSMLGAYLYEVLKVSFKIFKSKEIFIVLKEKLSYHKLVFKSPPKEAFKQYNNFLWQLFQLPAGLNS